MTVRLAFVLSALCSVLPAQTGDQSGSASGVLTVCQVLSMPLSYDGNLVTIRDRRFSSSEGQSLYGSECPETFVIDGFVLERSIWLQTIDDPSVRLHEPGFSDDRTLRSLYGKNTRNSGAGCREYSLTALSS